MNSWVIKHDELYHHGIIGMHWGQRNGPPYPLSPSAHSSSEKKDGWQKSLSGSKTDAAVRVKKGQVNKQGVDPTLVYYATYATVMAAIAAYGAIKPKVVDKKLNSKYKEELDKKRVNKPVDPSTGLHLKEKGDKSNDIKEINPRFNSDDMSGATQNCVRCTLAYEMRNRGYDVSAKLACQGMNGIKAAKAAFPKSSHTVVQDIPKGMKMTLELQKTATPKGNKELANKVISSLKSQPNSRGQLILTWGPLGGHSVAYEVKGGKVKIIDTQSGKVYSGNNLDELLVRSVAVSYQRFDNVDFDPKKMSRYMI